VLVEKGAVLSVFFTDSSMRYFDESAAGHYRFFTSTMLLELINNNVQSVICGGSSQYDLSG
jgi:hypothetical protein